jgi:hypothetical protein
LSACASDIVPRLLKTCRISPQSKNSKATPIVFAS